MLVRVHVRRMSVALLGVDEEGRHAPTKVVAGMPITAEDASHPVAIARAGDRAFDVEAGTLLRRPLGSVEHLERVANPAAESIDDPVEGVALVLRRRVHVIGSGPAYE